MLHKFKILLTGLTLTLLISSPVLAKNKGTITVDSVEIMPTNSFDSEMIAQIPKGTEFDVFSLEGDFYKIHFNNGVGFVYADCFSITKADAKISSNVVNVRRGPGFDHEVMSQLEMGAVVEVVGYIDEWYCITYRGGYAYIHMDFLEGELLPNINEFDVKNDPELASPKEVTYALVIAGSGLNMRKEPSGDSDIVTTLQPGTVLDVISIADEWVYVGAGVYEGYVKSEFIEITKGERPVSQAAKASPIIEYAKKYIGTPYQWGGTNLNKGVDCSGFVYAVYKNFGIKLNRSSSAMASNGVPVSRANLQPGDLILFDTNGSNNGSISHVGIYIGNGSFIHSSSSNKRGVVISGLGEDYYNKRYVSARRILQ